MCGRYAITLPPAAMRELFAFEERPNFPPRYNIAPTQPVPIVRAERRDGATGRHFALARWAFLPAFAKDPKHFPLVFNARREGLAEKASFRNAVRRRRCLLPADCFYEWQRHGSGKGAVSQPYLFRRTDEAPLALAGLWETWAGPNGEEVDTACIITTEANEATRAVHSRLPAILEPPDFDLWLDRDESSTPAALALLEPPGLDVLTFFAIGDGVNKVAHDGPQVQQPLEAREAPVVPEASKHPVQPSLFD